MTSTPSAEKNKTKESQQQVRNTIPLIKFKKYIHLVMCFFTWFSTAFIFVQIPSLSKEIKLEIFPSTDLTTSILMISITLSISLIARFLGALVLGSYANTNVIKIIIVSLFSLILLTLLQIWNILNLQYSDDKILYPIIFMVIRFAIGFFIGGIWPNMGIYALEEYYRIHGSELNKNLKDDDEFRKTVKDQYGFKSAIIQIGLTASYLVEIIIIIIITINSDLIEVFLEFLLPYPNLITIQSTSLIGCIFLVIVLLYWICYFYKSFSSNTKKKTTNYDYHPEFLFLNSKKNSLRDLLTSKKYRATIFNLWFITTGLMYMYYSTVIITPELLYRTQLTQPIQEEWITVIVASVSLIGHISLGFFYLHNSNKKVKENKDISLISQVSRITFVIVSSIIIIYHLIVSSTLNSYYITTFMFFVLIILAFLANAPWGLIPSILTSRFPKHFRYLAGSLVYNGGLVISFAAPFYFQQVILYTLDYNSQNNVIPNYYLILIPMFLGNLSVLWGSRRILNDYLPKSNEIKSEYGYFEIRMPNGWEESLANSNISSFSLKSKPNEFQLLNKNKEWMLSIYFLRPLNIQSYVDDGISYQLKYIVNEKIKLIKDQIKNRKYNNTNIVPEMQKQQRKSNTKDSNDEVYIKETNEEELFINSKMAKKKSLYINDIKEYFTALIIPYSGNVYLIFHVNNHYQKDTTIISRIIDTFDIKIPLKEI